MGYDAAIVGGGIIGAAIAFELARHALRVVVLDRQQPGLEASWAAAGMLAPGAETPDSVAVAPLGRTSLELYPEFVAAIEEASGRQCAFEQQPGMQVFFGEDAGREREAFLEIQRELGLPTRALTAEEARALEPAVSPAAAAAALVEREARVDSRALLEAALEAARQKGAEILAGTPVMSLRIERRRCAGVTTPGGEIAAGWTVIAAGCYSGGLAGVAQYAPTRPVRGQMAALASSKVSLRHVMRSARGYIVPRAAGPLICGSTTEDAGFEKRVTPSGLQRILGAAVELVPALEDAAVVETWSGLRPDSPDHLPILGPTDVDGLLIATGHYRNGVLLAPVTAKMIGEWVREGRTTIPAEKYSPMRFAGAVGESSKS